jgi:L-2-hydroxyglutarate oxidase LhgO
MNFLVVGGGLVGLGTALAVQRRAPAARVRGAGKRNDPRRAPKHT